MRWRRLRTLAKRWEFSTLRKALLASLPAMAGTLASFLLTYALCVRMGTNASPAVLSAVLALGLTRAPRTARRRRATPAARHDSGHRFRRVPRRATFLRAPIAGAVLFVLGMSASVALRDYGRFAAALGRTIALTLIAMLVVPVAIDRSAGIGVTIALLLAAAVIAQCCAWVTVEIARRAGLTALADKAPSPKPKRERVERSATLSVNPTDGAANGCCAAAAFVLGMLVFRLHWPWVVLSAFIVTSGAIGRGDALYKALLRVGGAIGGTLVATLLTFVHVANSVEYAALIFAVLFLGILAAADQLCVLGGLRDVAVRASARIANRLELRTVRCARAVHRPPAQPAVSPRPGSYSRFKVRMSLDGGWRMRWAICATF